MIDAKMDGAKGTITLTGTTQELMFELFVLAQGVIGELSDDNPAMADVLLTSFIKALYQDADAIVDGTIQKAKG